MWPYTEEENEFLSKSDESDKQEKERRSFERKEEVKADRFGWDLSSFG